MFINGFIKIYGEYLDLDVDKLLALFRRASEKSTKLTMASKKKKYSLKKFLTPQIISIASIALIVILALIYLYIQYSNFQRVPSLEIFQPKNDTTTNSETIEVSGKTDPQAILIINNIPVENISGSFLTKVKLNLGDNTIQVVARNHKNNKIENVQSIHIKYEKPATLPVSP